MPQPALIPQQRPRNYAWIWLCYTGFLFIEPLFDPSLHLWIATLTVFAIFLAIFIQYVHATDSARPQRFWMIAATFVLALIAFPWNQGASCLFVYTASFLPFTIRSVRRVLLLFAAESLLILGEAWLFRTPLPSSHSWLHSHLHISMVNAVIAVFLTLVIGSGQIFFAEQKRADCLLREAQEQNVTLAAVAERERIARDLHDVLGHTLSLIVLKSELAGRLIASNPSRAAAEIGDVERTARTALAEVREAIGGYRARGLGAEIEAARRTLDAAGVTLVLEEASTHPTGLTANEETVLALALREAVTNIVRHARATTCRLRFVTRDGRRRLVIEDNGQHAIPREGNGLRGMRERVESLGGQLSLERGDADHTGTRLSIELPAPKAL
jgi:two-component system sensor histidine kinase DesK